MTDDAARAPVAVLGAGCAGLSAAWRLRKKGLPVVVFEAADHVGGLAGGMRFEGNVYEYGPHVFHTTDPELLADMKDLMGEELKPFHRTIKIKFLGNYFQFPLSIPDVLFKLPPTTVLKAGASLMFRFVEGALKKPEVETSETVLRRYYGDVLYKIFFKDYIERVWGVPPAQFSPSFARERIPRLNLLEIVDKVKERLRSRLGGGVSTQGYVEKVAGPLYSTREGFSLITERMAARLREEGGEVRLNAPVAGLRREGQRLVAVATREGETACRGVINTLPIDEAARMISPALPPQALAAAGSLRYRGTVFVGLQVARPRLLPSSFMYFREHVFNRVTDLAHFGQEIKPAGTTILVAEVNCDPSDRLWSDEPHLTESVLADLERENLLSRSEVRAVHVFRARHAYPVYTLGYEQALRTLLDAFAALENLETAGRQGRFAYVNTHVAMKMGYEAADRLAARLTR